MTGEGADNATPYFYHLDQIGTPLEITDATGAVAWSVDYHSYGNVAYQRKAEIVSPLRFQGQYYDAETGLHYNRHRYYSPSTGRFITPDPIGLAGGLNNYQYVKNPTGWIDPLGLTQCVGDCAGSGGLSKGDIDPVLAKHLNNLPDGSYEIIGEVDRSGQGFTGDKAVKIKLLDDVDGHRFSGGGSNPQGPYVAIGNIPQSRYAARQLLALKNFGRGAYNQMTHYTSVSMKKGTTLYLGEVAPQVSKAGKLYKGGGTQAFVEFWTLENKGKVIFSSVHKMPRKRIVTE